MTALVVTLGVVVAILAVLVAGLLRSHATILRRLHELDAGDGRADRSAPFHTVPGVPAPRATGPADLPDPALPARVPDIVGTGLRDDAMVVRTSGSTGDTVLLFLSSGCATCRTFWDELADPRNVRIPPGGRLLVVTKGPDQESVSAVADLAPSGIDLVMSTDAWSDFDVPGSPYVVAIDGPTGRVKGEGTGLSWEQVANLLAQATGDLSYLPGTARTVRKPLGDSDREARVDRELLAAGILPGDPSLYADPVAAAHGHAPDGHHHG
ncbi:hypothetical protein GIS00_26025 [Nakamurella sp. YIM 132087]|uniref:Thioredoxin domain-containing protein n=1 Tax=Nakamurella alba TaxID=2665158 RepID=A0A7K1FX39_9ACTN|nr:hypothetical protein [Nakamurella alba]MTD17394.1 hypothetical protein [Nakamurella alba]